MIKVKTSDQLASLGVNKQAPPVVKADPVLALANEIRAATAANERATQAGIAALAQAVQQITPAPIEFPPAPERVLKWHFEVKYHPIDRLRVTEIIATAMDSPNADKEQK